jgi:hypothetical protein
MLFIFCILWWGNVPKINWVDCPSFSPCPTPATFRTENHQPKSVNVESEWGDWSAVNDQFGGRDFNPILMVILKQGTTHSTCIKMAKADGDSIACRRTQTALGTVMAKNCPRVSLRQRVESSRFIFVILLQDCTVTKSIYRMFLSNPQLSLMLCYWSLWRWRRTTTTFPEPNELTHESILRGRWCMGSGQMGDFYLTHIVILIVDSGWLGRRQSSYLTLWISDKLCYWPNQIFYLMDKGLINPNPIHCGRKIYGSRCRYPIILFVINRDLSTNRVTSY